MHSLIGMRNCPNHRGPIGWMEVHEKKADENEKQRAIAKNLPPVGYGHVQQAESVAVYSASKDCRHSTCLPLSQQPSKNRHTALWNHFDAEQNVHQHYFGRVEADEPIWWPPSSLADRKAHAQPTSRGLCGSCGINSQSAIFASHSALPWTHPSSGK